MTIAKCWEFGSCPPLKEGRQTLKMNKNEIRRYGRAKSLCSGSGILNQNLDFISGYSAPYQGIPIVCLSLLLIS